MSTLTPQATRLFKIRRSSKAFHQVEVSVWTETVFVLNSFGGGDRVPKRHKKILPCAQLDFQSCVYFSLTKSSPKRNLQIWFI